MTKKKKLRRTEGGIGGQEGWTKGMREREGRQRLMRGDRDIGNGKEEKRIGVILTT